ncbi:C-C motif chemokine 20 isoform X1 [Fundulus heteroclitus]|uniref:C-C motif chemokine 20 isoform X1 n=1 Tax=Fundulus heteroclitus TaxID=8078 RepID=UPI0006450A19|nr:C-C motif chemokine 20 isoform X1 [Fundulus heteroclitus]
MAKLAVCVSALLLMLVVLSETRRPVPCCTENYDGIIKLKYLKNFAVQLDTGICNINSTIFFTEKNKLICTDPKKPWVIRAMKHLKNRAL